MVRAIYPECNSSGNYCSEKYCDFVFFLSYLSFFLKSMLKEYTEMILVLLC